MYVYEGTGYLIGIDYEQDDGNSVCETDLVNAFNELEGSDAEMMEDIDDWGDYGDWNSPDNTSEATLNGEEVYGSRGVLIATIPSTCSKVERLLEAMELNPKDFYGSVFVECYD